jgi:WD40 repeat protein
MVFLSSCTLASASYHGIVRFWDTETGKEFKKIQAHDDSIGALALSPLSTPSDSQLLASGSADRTIRIWDLGSCTERQRLVGHSGWVGAVAFSPLPSITQMLASASSDKTVRLWDVKTGEGTRRLEGHEDEVSAVAFSSNGEMLASASWDKTIRLWSTHTGNAMRKLEGHSGSILAVAFSTSPSGSQVLASASDDKSIRLWNTGTGKETRKLEGHEQEVSGVAFSPSGKVLASVSCDKTCRLWDLKLGGNSQTMEGHSGMMNRVDRVVYSPDGQVAVSISSNDSVIRMWNSQTGAETKHFEGHSEDAFAVKFSPDGQKLASASFDKTVRIWDVRTGKEMHKLEGRLKHWADDIAFSPNGKILAAAVYNESDILTWDMETGKRSHELECPSFGGLLFSPDSRLLAAVPRDRTIKLLDVENGKTQKLKDSHEFCAALAFSPDSRSLASASIDVIKIWCTETGKERQELGDGETGAGSELERSHTDDWIRALAFSPDGKVLALASDGHPVRLWDVKSRKFMQDLGKNNYTVTLSFSEEFNTQIDDFTGCDLAEHASCSHDSVSQETPSMTILEIKNQWLRYLGQDVLWLPQEFRGSCWSVSGHKIAIGQCSGSVSFFQFG